MLKKLTAIAGIILLLLASSNNVYARGYASPYSSSNDPAYAIMEAVSKIKNFSGNSSNVPPAVLRSFLEKEIIPLFDFNAMARWITGRYARYMTTADKMEFDANLKETFLSSLDKHLGSFDSDNTKIRYYPARYRRNGEATVSVQVVRLGQFPARLDFRMKKNGYQWKIIDVKANGTSAVLYYRNHFMSQLRQYRR